VFIKLKALLIYFQVGGRSSAVELGLGMGMEGLMELNKIDFWCHGEEECACVF
jgi:hypothetical protein